jgi:hypothetical protein
MRFKRLMTWDQGQTKLRLLRIIWERGIWGKGGYSACFSLALMPKLFRFERKAHNYRLVLIGISFHYMRSYGGRFA